MTLISALIITSNRPRIANLNTGATCVGEFQHYLEILNPYICTCGFLFRFQGSEDTLFTIIEVRPYFVELLYGQSNMDALSVYTSGGDKVVEMEEAAKVKVNAHISFRSISRKGDMSFVTADNFNRDSPAPQLESNNADIIIFGRWFTVYPYLPTKLADRLALSQHGQIIVMTQNFTLIINTRSKKLLHEPM